MPWRTFLYEIQFWTTFISIFFWYDAYFWQHRAPNWIYFKQILQILICTIYKNYKLGAVFEKIFRKFQKKFNILVHIVYFDILMNNCVQRSFTSAACLSTHTEFLTFLKKCLLKKKFARILKVSNFSKISSPWNFHIKKISGIAPKFSYIYTKISPKFESFADTCY